MFVKGVSNGKRLYILFALLNIG